MTGRSRNIRNATLLASVMTLGFTAAGCNTANQQPTESANAEDEQTANGPSTTVDPATVDSSNSPSASTPPDNAATTPALQDARPTPPPLEDAQDGPLRAGNAPSETPAQRLAKAIGAFGDTPDVRRAAELAETRYAAAITAVREGNPQAALADLKKAVKLNSKHVAAWADWGAVLLDLNRAAEAEAIFTDGLEHNPDSADLSYKLGVALSRQGKNDAGKRALYRALELDEHHLEARRMLGRFLLAQGSLMEVSILYERWAELDPDVADAHNDLGVVLVRLGDLRRAEQEFRAAIRLDARHTDALYNLGTGLASLGRLDEAIGFYQAAIKADPKYTDAYFNLGRALLRQGKQQEAIEQFEKVIGQNNSYSTAHYLLGKVRLEQGDPKAAVKHLTEALRLSPSSVEARYTLGMTLLAQGRDRLAVPHFREAVRLKSDFPEAHYRLATTLAGQGNTAEALAHYRQALELRPDWPEVENNLSWIMATHADPAIRNPQQAVELAQHSVETLRRKIPLQLDSLAAAYAAAGDFQQAVATALQAVDAATAAGNLQLAADVRRRLALYEDRKPYVEEPAMP